MSGSSDCRRPRGQESLRVALQTFLESTLKEMNMSQQRSPTQANPATDPSPNASPATVDRQVPRLAPISKGGRLLGFAAAMLAATLSVGSQLALLAHYSGEVDLLLAKLAPASAAGQIVASAASSTPPRSISTKFDPARGSRWPWSHPQRPIYAQNGVQP